MNKDEIRLLILKTLDELLEDMSYYPSEGDTLYESLKREIADRIQRKGARVDKYSWNQPIIEETT